MSTKNQSEVILVTTANERILTRHLRSFYQIFKNKIWFCLRYILVAKNPTCKVPLNPTELYLAIAPENSQNKIWKLKLFFAFLLSNKPKFKKLFSLLSKKPKLKKWFSLLSYKLKMHRENRNRFHQAPSYFFLSSPKKTKLGAIFGILFSHFGYSISKNSNRNKIFSAEIRYLKLDWRFFAR